MKTVPVLRLEDHSAVLSGDWTLAAILPCRAELEKQLTAAAHTTAAWNLAAVDRLDSAGAVLLWRTWRQAWPAGIEIPENLRQIVERIAAVPDDPMPAPPRSTTPVHVAGRLVLRLAHNLAGMIALFGQLLFDIAHLIRHPGELPWREFSANVFKAGAQALPVTAMVGLLIGVAISYLSALQLRSFGVDVYIVNLLGISVIRELGPVLAAVLVAGRSGSAMTAQIGAMRVTEEIDALAAMGVPCSIRVVLPKVAALMLAMPLLVLWTSALALAGGMLAAYWQLDLSPAYFIDNLPRAVPMVNLVIGLGKGLAFGFTIGVIACYFGLHARPDTESLSAHTTASVVSSITTVILVDAVFAILTRQIGMQPL